MDEVTIDFNDAIYMETGIQAASVAVREAAVKGEHASQYRLYVTKRHVAGQITFYIALKNARGESVLDLQTRLAGQSLAINKAKSKDAVVIENVEDSKLRKGIELHSDQEKVNILIKIKLERPLASTPLKGVRKHKHTAQIKRTRSL